MWRYFCCLVGYVTTRRTLTGQLLRSALQVHVLRFAGFANSHAIARAIVATSKFILRVRAITLLQLHQGFRYVYVANSIADLQEGESIASRNLAIALSKNEMRTTMHPVVPGGSYL